MTEQEAIKNITNDACRCCKTYFEKCDEKEDCAYYIAIKALEKQIPKKPIIITNLMTKHVSAHCLICDTDITYYSSDEIYCHNCGQKIDWRNKNDREG